MRKGIVITIKDDPTTTNAASAAVPRRSVICG
jgi:hypothetical protein